MTRIVDLSMPVHGDMLTFPRVPPPALGVYESHTVFAERIGDDLERRLGGPQDIEWAVQGGEIFVLQARPVTA